MTSECRKSEKDTCGGCGKKMALVTISFRGCSLGTLCRYHPGFLALDVLDKDGKRFVR